MNGLLILLIIGIICVIVLFTIFFLAFDEEIRNVEENIKHAGDDDDPL
jgi:uncharacterized membrane protein YciS (DUF1049 family)